MVTSNFRDTTRAFAENGSPTRFSSDDNHDVPLKTSCVHIIDQTGHRLVVHRKTPTHIVEDHSGITVIVPTGQFHVHKTTTSFDHASLQQQTLAPFRSTIAITERSGFLLNVERPLGSVAGHQIDGLLAILIYRVHRSGQVEFSAKMVQ